MSQNSRLLHESNLSVRKFLIFLLMYPGPELVRSPAGVFPVGDPGGARRVGAGDPRSAICL